MQYIFKKNIDAFTAQKIASRVWTALSDNLFGKGEEMNFKGLQKRAKKTEINDKGKFKRKKRFGKSLANKAPLIINLSSLCL